MQIPKEHVEEIRALVQTGDIKFSELREKYKAVTSEETTATDDQLLLAQAATDDDDDDALVANIVLAVKGELTVSE